MQQCPKDWRRQLRSGESEDDRFTRDKGIRVALHDGPRDGLRELFELAEDSATQLDSYMDRGRVLVAVDGQEIVGHLQVVAGPGPNESEIKNMAVRTSHQGRGIGRTLVTAVIDRLSAEFCTTLLVATATADIDNLRFYQWLGFRMACIERDAFTASTGYPARIDIDGIELRDRVWLSMPLTPRRPPPAPLRPC
jgi:GNAT superfamily N-acetyltransferase